MTSTVSEQMTDATKIAREADINALHEIISKWRSGGITPSKCVEQGFDAAVSFVRETYPGLSQWTVTVLSTHIWEEATKRANVHAAQRKETKDK